MPPKPKYSREEVLEKAWRILCEEGASRVTARALGNALNTSSRPVFTAYRDMEELREALMDQALTAYRTRVEKAEYYTLPYKQAAVEMVLFAMREKHLFSFIFLEKHREMAENGEFFYGFTNDTSARLVNSLAYDYGLKDAEAQRILSVILSNAFSIACRQALGLTNADIESVQEMIGQEITAQVMLAKSGKMDYPTMQPVYRGKPDRKPM